MITVHLDRDAVHPADDALPPPPLAWDPGEGLDALFARCWAPLPRIVGGFATWSIWRGRTPYAVIAQDGVRRLPAATLFGLPAPQGEVQLRLVYHAQLDPDLVFDVLWRVPLGGGAD